jgi:hypothetical protein
MAKVVVFPPAEFESGETGWILNSYDQGWRVGPRQVMMMMMMMGQISLAVRCIIDELYYVRTLILAI